MLLSPEAMEEPRREPRPKKRIDPITQAFQSYIQKKNYPTISTSIVGNDEFQLNLQIETETNKPNSIAYSCINSDPSVIDQNFSKFLIWLKEIKRKSSDTDLDVLIAPLFCHLYLEILQRDHNDKATAFFNSHYPSIDRTKCDSEVLKLLDSVTTNSLELSNAKTLFRANKYVVCLSSKSVAALKAFLQESCHVVMLQVFQTSFQINEKEPENLEENEEDEISETKIMNGHAENYSNSEIMQKLMNSIAALKDERKPLYIASINNVKDDITSGLINRQRGIYVYSYNNGIHVSSLQTLQQLDGMDDTTNEIIFREHSGKIYDFAMMTHENLLVSASHDTTLKLFDLSNYSLKNTYKGHTYPVYCVTTSTDGCYIASGSYDISAYLWAVDRKNSLRICAGHYQEVTSIDFHPNSMYFFTGSADKAVRMWTIKDGSTTRLFLGSKGVIYCVKVSPCGRYLVTGGEDKSLRFWDIASGKQLVEMKTSAQSIVKLAWSTDGKSVAVGSIDGTITTWNVELIIKKPQDPNASMPLTHLNLGAKLLSVEYSFDTFGCLVTQKLKSRLYQCDTESFGG